MFIRSERLFLRPGWPEDWEELQARIPAEALRANLALSPMQEARAWGEAPQDRLFPHLLVTLPGADGARLVGCAGITRGQGDLPELGYWIARPHWGQGYATEAVRAVLGLARALGHRRIVAHHAADNPASGRVLAKAGFRAQGRVLACATGGSAEPASVPMLAYAIDLETPNDRGDGGGMGRGEGGMRRAA